MRLAHGTKNVSIHTFDKIRPFLVLLEDFHRLDILLLKRSHLATIPGLTTPFIIRLTKKNLLWRCVGSLCLTCESLCRSHHGDAHPFCNRFRQSGFTTRIPQIIVKANVPKDLFGCVLCGKLFQ